MNIDVAKALKELLFERESVILPGLGGFIGKPAASEVDYVQGAVQPPSKKLEFNTNLVVNDGVLVNYIQKKSLVTGQEAKMAIENYVTSIKNALEQKEIVDIPDIGRLYKDYEQKIRFMPEGTNFETESFGLPNVKFHPVTRRKPSPKAAATTAAVKPVAKTKAAAAVSQTPPPSSIPTTTVASKSWAEQTLPWLIVASAILLAIALFFGLRGCGNDDSQANVPQERVNVKPTEDELSTDEADNEEAEITYEDNTDEYESSTDENDDDGEAAAPPPTYNLNDEEKNDSETAGSISDADVEQIFVVVHSFGNRANAKKFAKQLDRAGYIPVTKKYNGLRRVGVEVPVTRKHEVDDLIKVLGRKFKAKPVVANF